jgi:alpha-galactosidase
MKRILCAILAALMLLSVAACGAQTADPKTATPFDRAQAWLDEQIKNNTLFSFTFDGKPYAEHIGQWKKTVESEENTRTVTYTNGDVTAWTEITIYPEFAAMEWTNYFKNNGSGKSPVISEIRSANTSFVIENPVLTTAEGSDAQAIDFQPITVDLTNPETTKYKMGTIGGRSSQGAWPYFDISNGEYGIVGAIGWTGDWNANFTNNEGVIAFDAGMQNTNIALNAGEDMRTPMTMLQFFDGDQDAGHNALRQLILNHYTPSDESGEPIDRAMVFVGISNMAGHGEEAILSFAKNSRDLTYECLWIDAGWYGDISGDTLTSGWSQQVGNWYFIPDVYPNGNVQKLGDYLRSNDRGFLLWFEPERAMPGTKLTVEHPEWFIKPSNGTGFYLLNLAMDEVCDYMIDWIGSMIQENHLTWYRQDFNCNPSERWRSADKEQGADRVGITEIKYITNEYRYLDSLIEMNPGLLIDNCASGGRRLDLEMMRRSVPLWNSDYGCSPEKEKSTPDELRSLGYNLSWWLPIHAGDWPNFNCGSTTYAFKSNLFAGVQINSSMIERSDIQDFMDEYFYCRELMDADFYPIACSKDEGMNYDDACYEFYDAEQGKGYIAAYRPRQCDTTEASYRLKGLDASATYKLTVTETGDSITLTGEELMTGGVKVKYPRSEFALIIHLDKI